MNESLDQVTEEAVEISKTITANSNALVIADQAGLEYAADLNQQAKREIKVIETAFKPHKDNAFKAHKDLCKAETEQLAPFKEIGAILKPKILKYQADQEEIERKAKEEREAKQRELEALAKQAAEKRVMEEAGKLMDAGDFDKAEMVMEAPIPEPMAAIVPEREKVKVAGAGTRKVRKGRVIDFSKVSDDFKVEDQKAINKYASALGEKAKADGIEFYWDVQLTGK